MIGTAKEFQGLYYLIFPENFSTESVGPLSCINSISSNISVQDVWHHRLGHPSPWCYKVLQKSHCNIPPFINKPCDTCHLSKQKHLPFSTSTTVIESTFDLIHVDIWGPCATPSIQGHKYFLTIVDEKSKFSWLKLMKSKSETRHILVDFIAFIETQFHKVVKTIRSDNGVEFSMSSFYSSKDHPSNLVC